MEQLTACDILFNRFSAGFLYDDGWNVFIKTRFIGIGQHELVF